MQFYDEKLIPCKCYMIYHFFYLTELVSCWWRWECMKCNVWVFFCVTEWMSLCSLWPKWWCWISVQKKKISLTTLFHSSEKSFRMNGIGTFVNVFSLWNCEYEGESSNFIQWNTQQCWSIIQSVLWYGKNDITHQMRATKLAKDCSVDDFSSARNRNKYLNVRWFCAKKGTHNSMFTHPFADGKWNRELEECLTW